MKLHAVHLLTNPNDEREKRSIAAVSQLAHHGIAYIPIVNPVWDGEVIGQREANDRPFQLTKAHYGCWKAHRDAIFTYLPICDTLLLFECDCIFTMPIEEVVERIKRAHKACIDHDLIAFTLGPKHGGKTVSDLGDWMVTTTRLIETHAYMVPVGAKERVFEMLNKPFDAIDYVWTVYGWDQGRHRIGIFQDRIIAVQANGVSLIDRKPKTSEIHFTYLEGQN